MQPGAVSSGGRADGLVVARVGGVALTANTSLPWVVLDGAGVPVEPAAEYLREVLACGASAASCRSYAFDLLRWFRFLAAVGMRWDRAGRVEVRDFVLWLRSCHNTARDRHAPGAAPPGSVNQRTGKASLSAGYAPATINHALSVIAGFYRMQAAAGRGPVVSPVPPSRGDGRRVDAHHNPAESFQPRRRGPYRQSEPEREPRAVPDDVMADLFAALGCHRDRALIAMFVSSGARASELLGMTVDDARPGQGRVLVRGKGLGGVKQACPASPQAFEWLALYLGELAQVEGVRPGPGEPLWWTRRRPLRPLTYTALRAVLGRVNIQIGASITAHDLRHTLCLRLIGDPEISLVDVQQVMRHRWITTTGGYLRPRTDEVIARVAEHYARPRQPAGTPTGWVFDPDDLADVFGTGR